MPFVLLQMLLFSFLFLLWSLRYIFPHLNNNNNTKANRSQQCEYYLLNYYFYSTRKNGSLSNLSVCLFFFAFTEFSLILSRHLTFDAILVFSICSFLPIKTIFRMHHCAQKRTVVDRVRGMMPKM